MFLHYWASGLELINTTGRILSLEVGLLRPVCVEINVTLLFRNLALKEQTYVTFEFQETLAGDSLFPPGIISALLHPYTIKKCSYV